MATAKPELLLEGASGAALPHPDATFDLVSTFTVFSSVLDQGLRMLIAGEIARVLRPGGMVLWYDMRLPNPRNRAIRPLNRRTLAALFPGFELDLRSITVIPPLARRLGAGAERTYPLVNRVPLLRSHLLGALVAPR